jgi:dimethylargininase
LKFSQAIVRPPSTSFPEGLTQADLGVPDLELTMQQHATYCAALEKCGLSLTRLEPDPRYPDSTFVEDTAILTARSAILTHPGAVSRRGEVPSVEAALAQIYPSLTTIKPPGTLDGGDVCQVEDHFFIGLSARTNEAGAQQLTDFLEEDGYTVSLVDIQGLESTLHLKSGMANLGDRRLVLTQEMETQDAFQGYEIITVVQEENYAANCLRVNDFVLIPAGHPRTEAKISKLGYTTLTLEMSEFEKMDGGLSCLSLRF